ncbi:MAG: glycoside hydrolase family 16 protein [Pseudomonadota bacterium]
MQTAKVLFCCVGLSMAAGAHAQCDIIPDCQLVWSDEFDGDSVDLTKWEFQIGDGSELGIPGWGNNEKQWYTANNATVADGKLTIEAREETVGNFDYTSSRLRTLGRGDWTFGRFEMRAKLPSTQGMWPAFWMLSSFPEAYGVWAASGEIDIMESVGSDPDRIFGTIHYGGEFPGNLSTSETYSPSTDVSDEFHVYAIEWDADEIRWYVDDTLYAVQNAWSSTAGPYPAPFDQPFYILLNVAVGGSFPGAPSVDTVFPVTMEVDYVRVYSGES